MKLRTEQKNPHNLYLQLGDEPHDDDPCLGMIISPVASRVIADAVNRSGVCRSTEASILGPERVANALRLDG